MKNLAKAGSPTTAEEDTWPFILSLRDDGTKYVSSDLFPGFHFILAADERLNVLNEAFRQFLELRDAAARAQGVREGIALDEAVVEAARILAAVLPKSNGWSYAPEIDRLRRALAARDAALTGRGNELRTHDGDGQ